MQTVLNRPLFRQRGGNVDAYETLSLEEKQQVVALMGEGMSFQEALNRVMKGDSILPDATGAAALTGGAAYAAQKMREPKRLPSPTGTNLDLRNTPNWADDATSAAKNFSWKDAARSGASSVGEGLGRFARTPIGRVGGTLARGAFGMPGLAVGTALAMMPEGESKREKIRRDEDLDQFFTPAEYQEGGPVPPQMSGIGSMQQQAELPPDLISETEQQSAGKMEQVGQEYMGEVMTSIDAAEEPEEMINALRGNELPIEARYNELAQIVGPEDAAATPETVLTLVQPTLMMTEQGALDSGIGQMVKELTVGAEMISQAGEPTDMGMGVGNLMVQGAEQPAMLPPPQNFAYGGGVMSVPYLSNGTDPGFWTRGANALGRIPHYWEKGAEAVRGIPKGVQRFGKTMRARSPWLIAGTAIGSLLPDWQDDWEERAEDLRDDLREDPTNIAPITVSNIAGRTPTVTTTPVTVPKWGGVTTRGSIYEKPQSLRNITPRQYITPQAYNMEEVTDPAAGKRMPVLEERGDFSTDYSKKGALRAALKERRDLYRDILGSGEDQRAYLKGQTLFDIAGAGAKFAAGQGAEGEDVRGLSPAAQAAAAFSGVPARMGERLEQERQSQRAIDLAALESAEKEEAARKEMVVGERLQANEIKTRSDLARYEASFKRQEGESERAFSARVRTIANDLTVELANVKFRNRFSQLGFLAELEDLAGRNLIRERGAVEANILKDTNNWTGDLKQYGANITVSLENANNALRANISNANIKLRENMSDQDTALRSKGINVRTQLEQEGLEINRKNIEARVILGSWELNHQESRWDDMKELKEEEREQLEELKLLERDFLINMSDMEDQQYTRREYLRHALKRDLKEEDWKLIDRKFQAEENRWAKQFGLEEDLIQIKKTNSLINGLRYLSESSGSDISAGPFGTGLQGTTMNILTNPAILNLYATGELDARRTAQINASIAQSARPQKMGVNQAGDPVYSRGAFYALPEALAAYQAREKAGLVVPNIKEFEKGTLNF